MERNFLSMLNLIGEFECRLDSKSRILFPVGLKRQIPPKEGDMQFVINRGFEQCIVLYTKDEWNVITEEINKLNSYDQKSREFIRYFYRGASELTLDKANRLLLPKGLLEYAGIEKDLTLFAFANKIEIWNTVRYRSLLNDEPENFAALAQEVMGKKNITE